MLPELEMERGPEEERAPDGPGRDIFSCLMFLVVVIWVVGILVLLWWW
jgi:hypothetical protein